MGKLIKLEDYKKKIECKEAPYTKTDLIWDTIINRLLFEEIRNLNKKE